MFKRVYVGYRYGKGNGNGNGNGYGYLCCHGTIDSYGDGRSTGYGVGGGDGRGHSCDKNPAESISALEALL